MNVAVDELYYDDTDFGDLDPCQWCRTRTDEHEPGCPDAIDAEPLPPPWPVGTHVRYTGNAWKRGESSRDEGAPWVRSGDVGVVVRVQEGTRAYRSLGERSPTHGWSVVQFHDDERLTAAVSSDRYGARYEAVE